MTGVYDICSECGINITISGVHLPFCSLSEGPLAEIEEGTEQESIMKFSASIVSAVEERVVKIITSACASVDEDERLSDEELDELLTEAKMTTSLAVMVMIQVLVEQELINAEKMQAMIDLFKVDWTDLL